MQECLVYISIAGLQGNSDVQVMVEEGSNIRITQNAFTADELSDKNSIQKSYSRGDGNQPGAPSSDALLKTIASN